MLNCIISFLCGLILGIIIHKYVRISLKVPNKSSQEKFSDDINNDKLINNSKFAEGSKLYYIDKLLEKIRNKEDLPIEVTPVIMRSLKTIATTPDWDKKLDEESVDNLYRIYNRCVQHIKAEQSKSYSTVSKAEGFEVPEEWEGTQEEYEKALAAGIIKDNTHVTVYTGTYLERQSDGSVEEYMD